MSFQVQHTQRNQKEQEGNECWIEPNTTNNVLINKFKLTNYSSHSAPYDQTLLALLEFTVAIKH